MKDLNKKVIIIVLIISGVLYMCISQYRKEMEHIDEVMATKNYDENDVNELANLIEEYNNTEYSDEEARKTALYYLLNTYYDTHFAICGSSKVGLNIKDINDRSFLDEMIFYKLDNDLYFNGNLIKAGDYHEFARVILESDNQEGHEHNIAEELDHINDDTILITKVIFAITYTIVIVRFAFLTIFNKKNYLKNIIIYALILLAIFIANIIICKISDNIINLLGGYKNYGFYGYANANSLLELGLFNIFDILKIFVASVMFNILINYKKVKSCFKKKK